MQFAKQVVPIMRSLRAILLPRWGNVTGRKKSGERVSVVTDVDEEVERYTRHLLHDSYPSIPFVGEENGGDRTAEKFWLMDPIDGTAQFIRGDPGCTSMLALIDKGAVVFSAIYDFPNDVMYWAERGHGAHREQKRLAVSNKKDLKDASIIWEMDLKHGSNKKFLERLSAVASAKKWKLAGWELIQIASGEADGRISIDGFASDYDVAAGTLIVSEAGGTLRNFDSQTYDYRNLDFVAGNAAICQELIALRASIDLPLDVKSRTT